MKFLKKANTLTVFISLLTFILGFQFGHYQTSLKWQNYTPKFEISNQEPPSDKKDLDFKLFWQTWDLVSKQYVDKKAIDPQKMYYGAISGMVAALGDPYTVFLPPDFQKSTKEELGGSFEGVGIQLGFDKDKRLVVIAPLKDTPADKAGVKPGDLIIKIDGKSTLGMSLPEAVNLIRGQKGTKVALDVYHEGDDKEKNVDLLRDTIIVKSVEMEGKKTPQGKVVAYLKLTKFGDLTFTEWNQAVSDALALGPQAVVLDLRNNPGGYLDGAVFIGSEFISDGNIVLQEDGQGVRTPFKVNRAGRLTKLPLIVMVNKGSASASEIVAGAVQDDKRGKLLGEQSFGKGTIQESQDLPGGTGIHITTAKWLTPNGRWIHNIGLTPDIKVELTLDQLKDPTKDPQLDKALEELDK